MKRVTFYIDGFNFYYGLRSKKRVDPEWGDYYWIDMVKFCQGFLGEDQKLEKVVYFTASPLNPEKSKKQSAFLNANRLLNGEKFEVVRGKYLDKSITCPLCKQSFHHPEEKRTDVNISVRMMGDCMQGKTDIVVLISADTDLLPPIVFINQNFPNIKVKVYFPPARDSHDIRDYMLSHRGRCVKLEQNSIRFDNAIMPDIVEKEGKVYTKPEEWGWQRD